MLQNLPMLVESTFADLNTPSSVPKCLKNAMISWQHENHHSTKELNYNLIF